MALNKKIYLDYNATTPLDKRVLEAMLPYFSEKFGNPGSDHVFGWDADEAVENAREQISKLVKCKSSELTFTSGATEAANLALFGFCEKNKYKGNHIITCKTEHKAILDTIEALERKGFDITYLEVDRNGNIDLEELEKSIKSSTILISLMLANNETGLIHPIQEVTKIAHSKNVAVLSDITQAAGKIEVDLKDLGIDMAIFSAHKLYGPKGVGALYISKQNRIELDKYIFGGGQEQSIRPGTLNVPGIVGFGKAAEIATDEMGENSEKILGLRNNLENSISKIKNARVNCKNEDRLPNTTNITFKEIDGSNLLRRLNKLAISRGSACSANSLKPSHVLKAMGINDQEALSSIRISLGRNSNSKDIGFAVSEIKAAIDDLKLIKI